MPKSKDSKSGNSSNVRDDAQPERSVRDPLESLPFAPPGLKNPASAILTRATRPETLVLIDRQIAKRRPDLENI